MSGVRRRQTRGAGGIQSQSSRAQRWRRVRLIRSFRPSSVPPRESASGSKFSFGGPALPRLSTRLQRTQAPGGDSAVACPSGWGQ